MKWVEMFGSEPEEWYWCRHCERVYRREEFEVAGLECPDPGCDGWSADMVPWSALRGRDPGRFPEVPERGQLYEVRE